MRTVSYSASVPRAAAEYFGPIWRQQGRTEHPIIEEVFWPGRGWRRHPLKKRVSLNEARRLRREGATDVGLRSGGRLADFRLTEVAR